MAGFCPKCGKELKEGAKFCASCGASIQQQPVQPTNIAPVAEQQYDQTQTYAPATPTKSKTGLIIGVVLVVAIVIIAIVAFLLLTGNLPGVSSSDESNLVGSWEYSAYGMSMTYTFNSDKTLDITTMGYTTQAGTWSINGGQLCIDYLGSYGGTDICYDYSISGNKMTWSYQGTDIMTLTKS